MWEFRKTAQGTVVPELSLEKCDHNLKKGRKREECSGKENIFQGSYHDPKGMSRRYSAHAELSITFDSFSTSKSSIFCLL